MDIVTQEQMDELDGLIKKYENGEWVLVTVAEKTVYLTRSVDVCPLIKIRKNAIAQEQCQIIVEKASLLLNTLVNIGIRYEFSRILSVENNEFYFNHFYFLNPIQVELYIEEKAWRNPKVYYLFRDIEMGQIPPPDLYDLDKIIETYTNLDKFIEYIKKMPMTKEDFCELYKKRSTHFIL